LPELFLSIYDELPEAELETALFELAQLAKAAAKAARVVDSSRTPDYLRRAIDLYSQAGTSGGPSRIRDAAEVYILSQDGMRAGELLDMVAVGNRDRFWHYRRSQAYGLMADVDAEMSEINTAIAAGPDDQYASSFLAERAQLKHAIGDRGWESDLERAIDLASNDKYREELRTKQRDYRSASL
jgi:hypothetical protein